MSAFGQLADISQCNRHIRRTFWFRQELCRIPRIIKLVKLMPFRSLVGLPMFTVRFVRYFGYPC